MEEQDIVLACGRWRVDKKRWLFDVDTSKGCRIIVADKETNFEDFTAMVFDDFGFCEGTSAIKLSYMLDRYKKSGCYMPPMIVSNGRQFQNFLKQRRGELIRLCVEIEDRSGETLFEEVKLKTPEPTPKTPEVVVDDFVGVAEEMGQKDEDYKSQKVDGEDNVGKDVDEDEADDEENSRFDYCDDSDGAKEKVCNKESNIRTRKTNSKADAIEKEVHKIENGGGDIAVGDKFDSKETLVARLRVLSVLDKYDYNVQYSTPSLLIVECWVKGCKWRIRASTMGDSPVFHIRKYCREHTCSITERYGRSRNAKPPILAQLYKDYIGGVGGSVVPNLVGEGLNLRYGVQGVHVEISYVARGLCLGYWKAHRTLIKAREYVRGTPESGYAELPAYLYRLRSSNPGTLTRLVVDAEDRFKYVFIAIAGCIKGFRYMRKVVVVDGTFLKGEFKGTLLIATTQDGNFNIFPLAYAVVDTEKDVS
ncbi:PREDICTED: uncharacterized protein LOC104773645 [Camelina sativa]|uniref:Uncharacterized protein LOC104773645 n=1 Tax=Camelina sativa TaxID=90675 RepID=A0ABM0Y759_CAMSA|nr:PREDICTED: uncharacterized protein LOC104773645 [Camelina sativa]